MKANICFSRLIRPERIPLSFSQERLWFIDQLEGSIQYHIPQAIRFLGKLDKALLRLSFREIVNRHEVLRTVLCQVDGIGYQKVLERDTWELDEIDGSIYVDNRQGLKSLIEDLVSIRFDLSVDSMLRAHLIRISSQEHVLVIVIHHIASDGWSSGIFNSELRELYSAYILGLKALLPELLVQYADYAIWQREYLHGPSFQQDLAYWQEHLAGVEPLELPLDYIRPSVQSTRGSSIHFRLEGELGRDLQILSQRTGSTLFMTLLSAFKVLLYRYSGQADICVGSPIAGRTQQELEGLIGSFVNTLVLRSNLSGNPSFTKLQEQVRSTLLEAYDHQSVPFEKVVETVVKDRDLSRSPLFQVLFVLQNTPEGPAVQLEGLRQENGRFEYGQSKFDLIFSLTEHSGVVDCTVEYCTDLYKRETILRMLVHYQELLRSIVHDDEVGIDELNMLTASEEELLESFNDTSVAYPSEMTLVDLFVHQARQSGDSIAVVFGETSLSYRELDRQSNQLGHYLRSLGVRSESLVPICLERSLEMIVGILGILKAGGAYVPIDPSYPQERIRYMLEDTGADVLISTSLSASCLGECSGVQIVLLDNDRSTINDCPSSLPDTGLRAEHLAYVIYTSGSTGKPKGVMVEHKNVTAFIENMGPNFSLSSKMIMGSITNYTFDISVLELLGTLVYGMKLLLITETDPLIILDKIRYSQLNVLQITPSRLSQLMEADDTGILTELNVLLVGGEALSLTAYNYLKQLPSTKVINVYGPTETTIWSSSLNIHSSTSLSIGRPLLNENLLILDRGQRLLPVGVPGEICIGGAGLSRGYLNRPELTKEKFVPNRFSSVAGSRLYRTGDLGRWLPDGNIEFLGRIDDQVKIRGYRIELGEIESVLQQSGQVRQVVVLAREDDHGHKRLIGYVVPVGLFSREGVMGYLQSQLPDYMVPSLWVVLESIPLTTNGKVDKHRLPDVDASDLLSDQYVAPRNELEKVLVEIWQELLGLERVGIHDNFFELGGHSLLVTRVASAVRKRLNINVTIKELFIHATLSRLCAHLDYQGQRIVLPSTLSRLIRPERIPLSFSQERLWFIDQLEGSIQYHIPQAIRFLGKLDKALLRLSFREIVNRHEVLRTVLCQVDGIGYQKVLERDTWELDEIDGSIYVDNRQGLKSLIEDLVSIRFDLSVDSMLRAHLIRISSQEHVLVIVIHHIASDGWSSGIFNSELRELYSAYILGLKALLPELLVQYADYAIWQREYLHGPSFQQDLAYWQEHLAGVEPLELPLDYIRPSVQSTRGSSIHFRLEGELGRDLQILSQRTGSTLFMTLLSAFKVLLYRYSGQADICVGSPIAGRTQQELEGLIGSFVNTLVLRSNLSGNPSFTKLQEQVRSTLLEAYDHQSVPFEKVVETVVKDRDLSRSPLFQVLFVLQNTPEGPAVQLEGLRQENETFEYGQSKFDLIFSLTEHSGVVDCTVEYCTDLYKRETILRMLVHYQELLRSIVHDDEVGIDELNMLTASEEELLESFNDTSVAYPSEMTLVDLFVHQARQSGDSIAVVFGETSLSYRELDRQSNQLGHYLRSLGVRSESLVPICLERSLEMIVGILGILKAGGAYVPIDPSYPQERIRYMLEDTGADVLISTSLSASCLGECSGVQIVLLDNDRSTINDCPSSLPDTGLRAEHLAYVIYTSGSTGKPKGVMVEHKGIVNMCLEQIKLFCITKEDKVFQFASISFDASASEIFTSLLASATLILTNNEVILEFDRFPQWLNRNGVTVITLPPVYLKNLLLERLFFLKVLITAGEQADVHYLSQVSLTSNCFNAYGPTEGTVCMSIYKVSPNDIVKGNLPIGKPIGNVRAYILDSYRALVPVGVPGEICIGGAGLSRGYLNRPELTKEKFVPNRFSSVAGSRLYRTGDLGRWLPDGNIEFLGRIDDQVKIRGYRIELGEIESVLQQSGQVRQVVVLAREDDHGHKRLIGYVVPVGLFSREGVMGYLQSQLPDYMVPSLWVVLESIPLTTNGKVDKHRLPDVDASDLLSDQYVAPRNELEKVLVEIWQELLGLERVGIHDNFFELGGHSLLVTRVASAVRKRLNINVTIKELFIHATLSRLCAHLDYQGQRIVLPSTLSRLIRPERIPLSFSQERLWFIDQLEGSIQYHIPQAIRFLGKLDKALLRLSFREIVNRHEVLRTVLCQVDGIGYQKVLERDTWELDEIDGSIYVDNRQGLKSLIEDLVSIRFDLSVDSMLRAHLIRISSQEHVLVIVIHHIASDGWSSGIFNSELRELYSAYILGLKALLPELLVQYADYAIWQREYLHGPSFQQDLAYWQEHLAGVEPLELPLDYIRPSVQSTRGSSIHFRLEGELGRDLQILSQRTGSTLFMTLLSAFKVLLYRYSGQADICVGSPIAGRTQQELEGLIGSFVNTLVLRSNLSGNPSFTKLQEQVRSTLLEAYDHQSVPFEKVVETVVKDRDLSRSPLFQVLFVLQNTPEGPAVQLEGLRQENETFEYGQSKFDLIFSLTEHSGVVDCTVEYCTDLYKRETILRMLVHYQELLRSIVHDDEVGIDELNMLTASEEELLESFNDTSVAYPSEMTLVDLFVHQARQSGDSIAVVFGETSLSYRELDRQSNQLGHYLRSLGVRSESLVPICLERSLEMIVGILGILKAGGAYVPIDPSYPQERIRYMLEDTGADVLISTSLSASCLGECSGVQIVLLDNDRSTINDCPSSLPDTGLRAEHLAYVIYTSGSTGKPKGVMVEHKNVTNLIAGMSFLLNSSDVILSTGSPTFDATTFEYWSMLLNSGKLILCSREQLLDTHYLKEEITRNQVNKMWFTSSWLNQLIDTVPSIFKHLEIVMAGGERLSESHIAKLQTANPFLKVINGYGPTENTTFSLMCFIKDEHLHNIIPIGKPINNTQIYILDRGQRLLPVGVPGEICIGGAGLSRGYLNRPELTKEKFVPNRFSSVAGSRLYRTGDLGRWLPDGNIEFLGRIDDQVKIRGYRIELGEIESVLQQSGQVRQVVVLAREDDHGHKRLIGYVVPVGLFSREGVMGYLQSQLPDYMVPSLWVVLESIPLTTNGKVDKHRLPDVDASDLLSDQYVAPRNELEKVLVEIWQELLGLERVGIHDNFFELGGDSIITIQVTSRSKRAGYDIRPKDIFSYKRIADISAIVISRQGIPLVISEQGILSGKSGLLPIQQWFLEKQSSGISHYNQSMLMGVDKSLSSEMLSLVVTELFKRHDVLRFWYSQTSLGWEQTYGEQYGSLRELDLQGVEPAILRSSIESAAISHQSDLDICKGDLVRVVFIMTPASEALNRILFVIHHLAIDGVSWRILQDDMELLVNGLLKGETISLGYKGSSYRDWYRSLEGYGCSRRLRLQLPYWERITAQYTPLPSDYDYSGAVSFSDWRSCEVRLSATHTRHLLQEVPRVYHTEINDILLSALGLAISKWTGQNSVHIGLEGHGREEGIAKGIDLSRTVGWFTSLYPVSLEIAGSAIGDIIKGVKEHLRGIPDKGLGYGVLRYINKESVLCSSQPWDIVFNYLGQFDNVVSRSKWFTAAAESTGSDANGSHEMQERLTVNSQVLSGELVLYWGYSSKHYNEKTIHSLCNSYLFELQSLISYCMEQDDQKGVMVTPSDYGLGAEIDYKELDRFLNTQQNGVQLSRLTESIYRLSGLQQGMLFHGLYDEQSKAYIEQFVCELRDVDSDILSRSWKHLLSRHSILRSSFHYDVFSIPVQCVHREVDIPLTELDYSGLDELSQEASLRIYEEADRTRGFNFNNPPLMRISLIRLSKERYRMIWTSHHMLFDGWSLQILMGELLEVYESLVSGMNPDPFKEDRYEDYIRYLERQDKEEEEAYWQKYMSGLERPSLLPFVQNSSERTKGIGEYHEHRLSLERGISARVNSYAQRNQLTVNTVMQGVWSYLLSQYTGNSQVTYGVTVSGRPEDLPGMESRVGMYINTLPLYTEVPTEQSVVSWLQQIQAGQISSRHYQYSSLSDIQQWLKIPGDLFDSLLVFENYPMSKVTGSKDWSLKVSDARMHEQTNYPLGITIIGGSVIHIAFSYNSQLLAKEYVKEISDHFSYILEQIVHDDEVGIDELNMLTASEEELLESFNDTSVAYPSEMTLVDLFVHQARQSGDSIAVVFGETSLSYRELDRQSNQLGHYLRSLGVRSESLVPICLERSLEMIVGILGILKAGGAYVPIDPSYPQERIRYMLEDTGADVLISTSLSASCLGECSGVQIVLLDNDRSTINDCPSSLPDTGLRAEHLAYVIYTSGSTGKPKGVMVEHKNVTAFIQWCIEEFNSQVFDVVFGVTSYCFDLSVFEVFYTLSIGKQLCLLKSGLEINQYLSTYRNILINTVPSILYGLLEQEADLSNVTVINLAGEPVSIYIKTHLDYQRIQIRNLYGPSEDTIYTTSYLLEHLHNIIPIGKPINNTQIYILDRGQRLLPVGVPGEICIGGAGLSRGYLNRPELTKEKFVPNRFSSVAGSRLYRTGDLGRWLPDGNIEFLGRIDDQVKIRGYRIELGEIESVLQQSGQVRQVVVLAREDDHGHKRLIGYVVPVGLFSREGVMGYLQSQLPDYMVPSLWVVLESIPLTTNGKVDKHRLPDVDASDLLSDQYVAPRNELEKVLVEIWQELLGLERVGIHDNFFELGGDSIITIQVTSRSKRAGYDIRPKDIFSYKRIADISAIVISRQGIPLVISEQGILSGKSGLLPIQQWFLEKQSSGISHYNQSMLMGVDKSLSSEMLSLVVTELFKRHDVLRFWYSQTSLGWEQTYGEQYGSLRELDLQGVEPAILRSSIESAAISHQSDLDICKGDLVRVVFIMTPASEALNRILFVIHHLAIDGVSWRILQDDMELLVNGLLKGETISLGYKGSSYRDWYRSLEGYGCSRRLRLQLPYWERITAQYTPLPSDYDYSGAVSFSDWRSCEVRLSATHTRHLLQEVPRVYHTEINDILLSALGLAISKWTGQNSVHIGLEGHGREEGIAKGIDLSRTVGWFTSLYPVSLEIAGSAIGDIIKGVKEHLRGIPDKGLGYGVLRYINKESVLCSSQPWDIVFNYLGQFDNVVSRSKWFTAAAESTGSDANGSHEMQERLTVNSQVLSGELVLYWGYSSKHYNEKTIHSLCNSYLFELQSLISYCMEQDDQKGVMVTPSDYGLGAEIDYKELDRFLNTQQNGVQLSRLTESIYRLSGLQQGMLFHGLYDEQSKAYIEQFVCELRDVDSDILSRSWKHLLSRHSILRSSFHYDVFSIPVQCVHREVDIPLTELDYSGLDELSQEASLRIYEEADRTRGFNFNNPPLMRISLIRLSKERYRMIWTSHHMLFDGWSLQILMGELLEVYESLVSGMNPDPFKEDRYEDYIRYLERQDKEEEEAYWQKYMSGLERPSLLPFVQNSSERTKGIGEYHEHRLSLERGISARVNSYAQRNQLTVNTVMQGVWSYLLSQYTGNSQVTYGVTVSGRPEDLPGMESRVGMYINTLPLYTEVPTEQSVVSWLQQIQAGQISSRHYQYSSLSDIQQWLKIPGDLFDSLLVFENYPMSKVTGSKDWSLKVSDARMHEQTNYPLGITIIGGSVIHIAFSYNSQLLAKEYVKEISDHFSYILEQIVHDDEVGIDELNMLTASEEELLESFNDTSVAYPSEMTLVDLFVHQARQSGDSIAVVFGETSLSYRELDRQSNQLGHYLRSLGVRSESLVPICLERSLEMIVGILGILKAGGAYVPIDPSYPQERIRYMLEDTGADVLISTSLSASCLGECSGVQIVLLDNDRSTINDCPSSLPDTGLRAEHLAYVIYTSGSTGKPKGVMVEHKNVTAFIQWCIEEFNSQVFDVVFGVTSYCFDLSVFEVFYTLSIGKQLCLLKSGLEINQYLSTYRNILINTVPSILYGLLEQEADLSNVTVINLAGEPVSIYIKTHLDYQRIQIRNLYGPSEDTIYTTSYLLEHLHNIIPIGKPINNTQIYILDRGQRLLPVGVPGEICIGGAGLSRGYLNRPELTKEKFVPNRFSSVAGSRLYRTGDLGRWLPDGNIEFLGRIDDQVKIRGYRIELGEIESVLQQSGQVRQVVVLAREDDHGHKRLIGYVVPVGLFSREGVMGYLQSQLPDYMVPSLWVVLESIPLTTNGKVDKHRLPDVDASDLLSDQYVAPRNELEKVLVEIWQELLGLERVGIHDNFFELGGDSIITIQVTSRSKRAGYDIRPKDIFSYKRIADISAIVISRQGIPLVISEQGILSGKSGLLPIQQWFLEKQSSGISHYNQSMLMGVDKSLSSEMLSLVVTELFKRHDVLRFWYSQTSLGWEQTYGEQYGSLRELDLQGVEPAILRSSIESAAISHQSDLDICKGDLVRVVFIMTPASEALNRILFVIHHLAIDGVSWRILQDDMELLVNGLLKGETISLGYKGSSYRDWYRSLEGYGCSRRLRLQLPYWERITAQYTPLPSDYDYSGAVSFSDWRSCEVRLSATHTRHLLQEVPRVYHTEINDILLSALGLAISKWTGQNSVHIGLEGHGREEGIAKGIDLSRTVGWFTSLYPVSLEIAGSAIGDIIKGVKEHLRGIPDKGLGYGVLRYINKESVLCSSQPWDIVFNYLGQFDNVVSRSKWFTAAAESTGSDANGSHEMQERLTVNSQVLSGELVLYWGYSSKHYNEKTIHSLCNSYLFELQSLISYCMEQDDQKGVMVTPSDYGLGAEIDYKELDRFLNDSEGPQTDIMEF